MRVDLDINGARVTITGDRLQVSVAEEYTTAPVVAAEATGNDLREPVAAEQGRIVREGDAPREASNGKDRKIAHPDTELPETAGEAGRLDSGSLTEIVLKSGFESRPAGLRDAKGGPTGMGRSDGGERPATISEKIKLAPITVLRPNCLSPDSCAGHGRNHCHRCRKVLAEGEAA